MTILNEIEKLGIASDDFVNLSDIDIVRLEKKIKSEQRINQNIDTNTVTETLDLLKNYQAQLKTLFSEEYEIIKAILLADKSYVVLSELNYEFKKNVDSDAIAGLFEKYFEKHILEYANRCIINQQYFALFTLLLHANLLSVKFKETIAKKLYERTFYCLECIGINATDLEKKIQPLLNPFFYRSLSCLDTSWIDDDFQEAIYRSYWGLEGIQKNELKYRMGLAMGAFNSSNEELNSFFDKYRFFGHAKGARERKYSAYEKNKKGGTYFNVDLDLIANDKKPGLRLALGIVIGTVILFFILKVTVFDIEQAQYEKNKLESVDPFLEAVEEMEQLVANHTTDEFRNKIDILTDTANELLSEKDIPFKITETNFTPPIIHKYMRDDAYIFNNTSKQLVVHLLSDFQSKVLFLLPHDKIQIPTNITSIIIYGGKRPQIATVKTADGKEYTGFRFKTSSNKDWITFNKYKNTNISLRDDYKYTLYLYEEQNQVYFELEKGY